MFNLCKTRLTVQPTDGNELNCIILAQPGVYYFIHFANPISEIFEKSIMVFTNRNEKRQYRTCTGEVQPTQ